MATTSTIPEALRDLFDEPALAHVSYLNRKGQIVTYPMWVDFDGEHLMVSSPVGSRKGKAFRERPQVAVSISQHQKSVALAIGQRPGRRHRA